MQVCSFEIFGRIESLRCDKIVLARAGHNVSEEQIGVGEQLVCWHMPVCSFSNVLERRIHRCSPEPLTDPSGCSDLWKFVERDRPDGGKQTRFDGVG